MAENLNDLGKLISVHGISPVYLQRALFIAILSFCFFLAMMTGFYLRQNIVYFLLATAFLLIYVITLFSWMLQRRNQLRVYENGLTYKKSRIRWNEIREIEENGGIVIADGGKLTIPRSINDFGIVLSIIRARSDLSR
jgi:hypothetical protein